MTRPTAAYESTGSVWLRFPYNPVFIAELKERVPSWARSWDPAAKIWTISSTHADAIVARMRSWWPDLEVLPARRGPSSQAPPHPTTPTANRHYEVLCITPDAPAEIVAAVYRAWCKLTHPDALPSGEREEATRRMQQINMAYESLQKAGRV